MSDNKLTVGGNSHTHRTTAAAKLAAPPKGYTRIWIDVRSNTGQGKDGQVNLPDADMERSLFARFGLRSETQADLEQLKQRLQSGGENPFDYVTTNGDYRTPFRADGNYRVPVDVKNELYAKLSGKAALVKQQIQEEEKQKTLTNNQNEITAAKNGINTVDFRRSMLVNKLAVKDNQSSIPTTAAVSTGDEKDFLFQQGEVKLALTSSKDLPLQDRIDGKLLRQTLDPNYDYIWGDKFPDYIAEAKQKGLKPEVLNVVENGENTDVTVKLSAQDINILRQMNQDFQLTRTNIDQAREHADTEVNNMFLDQGKVLWNSGVNIVEGTINQGIDAAMNNGGQNPVYLSLPDIAKPHVDFSGAKFDYRSEMMRRNIEGKIDGDGIKAGQFIETGVTIGAPLIIGKVFAPVESPQSLKSLGGLPEVETTAATVENTAQTAAKVGRLEVEEGRTLSPPEKAFADKMVGEGKVVKAPKEVNIQGVKNPDFNIDDEIVEFKNVSDLKGMNADKLSGGLSRRILDGKSQASKVTINVENQTGMTEEIAKRAVDRAYGALKTQKNVNFKEVRIYGKDFDFTIPFKK